MKTLLKQKVHADQTSQPNGYNRVTRQSAGGNMKLELVDPNRSKGMVVEMDMSNQHKSQPAAQASKRGYAVAFQPGPPIYASSVNVQQTASRDDLMDDGSDYSSSAASYSQPAAKKGAGSLLRSTLAEPRDNDTGRKKNRPGRKPTKSIDHMTEEEYRRLEERRLKNKEAAQRCRSRRMGKISELEERIRMLNGEINLLKTTHEKYKSVPGDLEYFIGAKNHVCCLASTPPARPIQMPLLAAVDPQFNRPSPSKLGPSKGLNSPTTANRGLGPKRPQFLNRPISNLVTEQKRPSSQPSPSVMNSFLPSFSNFTPGQSDFLNSFNNATPGLPSFGGNGDLGSFGGMFDERTPSRELAGTSVLYQALDLQNSIALETPNTETPRLTAL